MSLTITAILELQPPFVIDGDEPASGDDEVMCVESSHALTPGSQAQHGLAPGSVQSHALTPGSVARHAWCAT